MPHDTAWLAVQELEHLTPDEPTAALMHVRLMFQRISELATAAAEERWPGFGDLVTRLLALELELEGKAAHS